jgi:hypothetical protein
MKLSAIIDRVCALADAVWAHWDAERRKRCPTYPFCDLMADLGPPPPQEKELRDFLTSLRPGTLYALVVLMYLGRGDLETGDDLLAEYERASNLCHKPAQAVEVLLSKVSLASSLRAGVEKLARAGRDVDGCWLS